jgi:hypothetical protein
VAHPDIVRTSTNIALTAHIRYRTGGLLRRASTSSGPDRRN